VHFDRLKRREFIALAGGAVAWPLVARAQQSPIPVVGFLHFTSPSVYGPRIAAFREALSAAGYVEGKNLIIDFRSATNVHDFQQIASQLVASKVSLIVASGSEAISAARQATQTIPIVMTGASDPLGTGFVKSLARPGGNITGFSLLNPELAGKRLELLREIVADPSPAMVLWNSADPPAAIAFRETERASVTLGIEILSAPIHRADEIERAFATNTEAKSLVILPAPIMGANAALIADQALRRRLPLVSNDRLLPRAGGLLAYGPNFIELFRQSAVYVAKILSGANPGDLPVQQPTKFELVINLKTAKALGLTVPPMLLARADEVIE
jgi:putative ABC transport system substrate-binding protein